METKLDKDFNPIWVCDVAGLLFPALLLVAFVVWAAVHGGRNLADWAIMAWCSFLLFAFWLRYQSGKVTSLLWEFHFGMWLSTSPMLAIFGYKSRGQYAWVGTSIFSLGFIFNAARYIKCFYLSPDSKG